MANRILLCVVVGLSLLVAPSRAQTTLRLAPVALADGVAGEFRSYLAAVRPWIASTTGVWGQDDAALDAWGPALIFPAIEPDAEADVVVQLARSLTRPGTAVQMMFRTVGLYAAKSRVAFVVTPELRAAVDRNLEAVQDATHDFDTLLRAPELDGWGSLGVGAWLAYLQLQYRDFFELESEMASRWNGDGVRVVEQLLARGQIADSGGFRRDPRDDETALWPTALAILALMRAYENQPLPKYEHAARKAAEALDRWRDDDGAYWSDDQRRRKDPRANAFVATAWLQLFKNTGNRGYRDRAVAILRWYVGIANALSGAPEAGAGAQYAYLVQLLDQVDGSDGLRGRALPLLGLRPLLVPERETRKIAAEHVERLRPSVPKVEEAFARVLGTLLTRVPRQAGDFAYDHGDAPGAALDVLVGRGEDALVAEILSRQQSLLGWPRRESLREASYGAAGLVALVDARGPHAQQAEAALRRYLLLSGGLAFLDRYYLDWLSGMISAPGSNDEPIALGARVARAHLGARRVLGDGRIGWLIDPLATARQLAETTAERARAATVVGESPLLSRAAMISLSAELSEAAGDSAPLDRARGLAAEIDILWVEERGAFQEQEGEAAFTLEGNLEAAVALLRLARAGGGAEHEERARRVLDFIRRDLYADGIVYPHLVDGRRATGDVWCSGCNWRWLAALQQLPKPR